LTKTNIYKIETLIPKPQEQQKIASCLSSLDDLITAQSQKLDLLKDHKKGMMQNLFPQEGEKVPKFRFQEFENDGEWVEKTIDKVKSVLTDYVANGSFQSLRENLNVVNTVDFAFYVRLTDLRGGLGHSNQKYVDESTYKFLNKSALFGGELLMANIGANVGEVWQMPNVNKPATLAPNMIMIKLKKDIDSGYVFQYLTSDIGVANISTVISGSGHPKISKTDLRQVKVTLPPRIKEQQKIASCLSSLDALITSQTEKISQLKLHKNGLMQRLFPRINN
jgi:type I restriction enzyme S subunit